MLTKSETGHVPPAPVGFRILSAPVLSWAMYDFANTIFSFAVITQYFNEWIVKDKGEPDWKLGLMSFVVGLALVVAMPAFGAVSDRVGRRMPFLAAFTLLCVVATAGLGAIDTTTIALMLCGVAIFFYQLAVSMYDPLLPVVAPEERRATVSGLGVGLGYLGALVGAVSLLLIVGGGTDIDRQDAFIPTALMFLVFSLPTFLFVREPRRAHAEGEVRHSMGRTILHSLGQVVHTVAKIWRTNRPVGRFLIARFLYVDAIATVIAVMTIYMERLGDASGEPFAASQKTMILGFAMICAAIGAFISGRLVEAWGPKRVLVGILVVAALTLTAAAASGARSAVWALGPLVGISLGAVWTSDRIFMLRLSPPTERGEFFGVYNLIGKLSSGFGPLVLWGGTTWLLFSRQDSAGAPTTLSELGASRVALVVLALAIVAGILVLRPLSDERRYPDDEGLDGDGSPALAGGGH